MIDSMDVQTTCSPSSRSSEQSRITVNPHRVLSRSSRRLMTIYALCAWCGEYLDRDGSVCRACGADNDPDAKLDSFDDETSVDLAELDLDRLHPWSRVKHEIVEKYAAAYTTILGQQKALKRFVYIDAFAGAGV